MTAFVILAAGRGTRIGRAGDFMHKCLVPLEGKAIISHLFELAPPDARIAVMLGHRDEQVKDYVTLAHPDLAVEFIRVPGWDETGGGPGHSLRCARPFIDGDDFVFTSCDTLWDPSPSMWWEREKSWSAVAPIPSGTPQDRWCRMVRGKHGALRIMDKTVDDPGGLAYVGLSSIIAEDADTFWNGLAHSGLLYGELQVTAGLSALAADTRLDTHLIHWTDVGDEDAYARAVALRSGYDWTKLDEVTYIVPESRRVVKFFEDRFTGTARETARRLRLQGCTPEIIDNRVGSGMLAYRFIEGTTAYAAVEADQQRVESLVGWAWRNMWSQSVAVDDDTKYAACIEFYRNKTLHRITQLHPLLQAKARDAVTRIDWGRLAIGCTPVRFHGDFNFGNIMHDTAGAWWAIDWRGDFAGHTGWGDMRYDMGKLLAGTVVHWDNARRGDFRPWSLGNAIRAELIDLLPTLQVWDINVIGALSLINSAPLHASPLDEILVARGTAWLEETA